MSSTKALARAFTKRVKRSNSDANISPSRNTSVRYARGTINRGLISLPTELISTTNVQALTAPCIPSMSRSSSGSSVSSSSESEFSSIDRSFLERTVDDSTVSTPITPPMDGIDSFFDYKTARTLTPEPLDNIALEAPILPQRAPSHSKRAHMELSRKLSMKRLTPPPTSMNQATTYNHVDHYATFDSGHPFVRELAQVNEMTEEFGSTKSLVDAEERDLFSKGLRKFTAEDYLDEIAGLSGGVFENRLGLVANPWL